MHQSSVTSTAPSRPVDGVLPVVTVLGVAAAITSAVVLLVAVLGRVRQA